MTTELFWSKKNEIIELKKENREAIRVIYNLD